MVHRLIFPHKGCDYRYLLQVLGSKGMLQVHNILKEPVTSYVQSGVSCPTFQHSFPQRYKESYISELRHFISVVRDPIIPLYVTKEEVLLVSQITDACECSLKEERLVTLEQ